MTTQEQSDKLRQEAKDILNKFFGMPENTSNQALDRIIDCIIGAAVLQVAATMEEATK